jgi:hypothetical protein
MEAGLAAPRDGLLWQEGIAGVLPLRVVGEGRTRTIAVRTPQARVVEIAAPAIRASPRPRRPASRRPCRRH